MAGGEEWTDDELLHEMNRLRAWIYAQNVPVEDMAKMLLHERAVLRARAEWAEHLAGLDWERELVNVCVGVFVGCVVSALLVWAL